MRHLQREKESHELVLAIITLLPRAEMPRAPQSTYYIVVCVFVQQLFECLKAPQHASPIVQRHHAFLLQSERSFDKGHRVVLTGSVLPKALIKGSVGR